MRMRACVRACVRVCVCACVRVCVRVVVALPLRLRFSRTCVRSDNASRTSHVVLQADRKHFVNDVVINYVVRAGKVMWASVTRLSYILPF